MNGFSLHMQLPDLWQQEAVRAIKDGRDVVVDAPTGAGKTWIFELLVQSAHFKGQLVYTVPTRALANDKRLEWQRRGWHVGIVTGEISQDPHAPIIVATLETQRDRLLHRQGPQLLVVDEYQMLADPIRGMAYEMALALAPPSTQLLLLSGSVANPKDIADWLLRLGRPAVVVRTAERPVPLEEMPVEQLPRRAPQSITGFWPRLAADVLLSQLGPLLIFAPHRKDTEKIARQIAAALPSPDPLTLTREQENLLGKDTAALLRARIAFHHSGLSYQQRAGIIEPLAKAGQLRVVVATMGLAAGINFSMRSVLISDQHFFDGLMDRQIAPDELLQMFGRAGRRGLDSTGYAIVGPRTPRLMDANPRHLKRANQVDWPSLLRVMDRAAQLGEPPFPAAAHFCSALFSRQRIDLGFENPTAANPTPDPSSPHALFNLGPTRREIRNSRGAWEEKRRDRLALTPLRLALLPASSPPLPALQLPAFLQSAFPLGRACFLPPLDPATPPLCGREWAVALEKSPEVYALTKPTLHLTGFQPADRFSQAELDALVLPRLAPHLSGGRIAAWIQRRDIWSVQIDFSEIPWPTYQDQCGAPLIAPEERTVALPQTANFLDSTGTSHQALAHTAVHAWRQLGLIDPDGTPTRRGSLFSHFHGGEGLAIAAALEDPSYSLPDLTLHLANLRGGHRFSSADHPGSSQQLAAACLRTYGAAHYPGYLDAGLPCGYGEGTAEILLGLAPAAPQIGPGDLERALTEWISLLRQVTHAPPLPWDRWIQFQTLCAAELAARRPQLPSRQLPQIPARQLTHQTAHHFLGA